MYDYTQKASVYFCRPEQPSLQDLAQQHEASPSPKVFATKLGEGSLHDAVNDVANICQ